ncbi:hypothetical protein LXL04_035961 [Taraxacum kok-saghyz]
MAKEVGARAILEHLFDVVIMVDVTQTANKKSIQSSIAEMLGFKTTRREFIDDIWSRLDLNELGIPFGSDGGCKILLTSRSISACNQMRADKIFKIREMPVDEAWILFEKTSEIENSIRPNPNLHQVARDIVEECGGLPLAIVTIARALESEKDKSMWDDVLQRLRSYDLEGEYASVYSSLEVTYNFLESDEIKHVFLLCCLFPEGHDISIEDLLRLGLGLSLFKKTGAVCEARIRLNAFVQKLKNLNILLDGGDEKSVKLHDLVRDSGLKIASKNKHVFVVNHGDGLRFWPSEFTDERCTAISLRCDEMSEIPGRLNCPKLELLLLVGGNHPLEFPTEYCTFDKTSDISKIGNLEKLETLSFVHSDVKELPIEIGNLSKLKVLDLTGCGDLFNIAPGVLQRLIHLEELYMSGTLISWPDEQITTCIRELNSLSLLTALEIEISIYKLLPDDINFSKLTRFRVCIGFSIETKMFQNTLKVRFPSPWVDVGIEILFNKTEILHLHGWSLLPNSILNKSGNATFLMLRNLKLENCGICYLTEICQGQNHVVGENDITVDEPDNRLPLFENLHDLEIVNCVNLKCIFSLFAPTDFHRLETLKIIGCQTIKEIFLNMKRDHQDERPVVEIDLPNLKCLILENLPCLTGFYNESSFLVLPQLLEFRLHNLPNLRSLNIVEENTSSPKNSFFNQKVQFLLLSSTLY